ncbi:MAG: peptidylprolyl isomerase [Ruminococcus sp.]|nr:peptidylprolyl isomerase [Ruminococcus sp.]
MKEKENKSYADVKKSQRFRSYFQFSMIAVVLVLIFALFNLFTGRKGVKKVDPDTVELIQFEIPADDAPVAVFETNMGTFRAVVYKEQVPQFSEYFIGKVGEGYYDGTNVFAVQKDVYFMGGSKSKDGADTSDTDKTAIEPELCPDLWPFRGALISYGDKGGNIFNQKIMSGSRILFCDTVEFTDEFKEEMDSTVGQNKVSDAFKLKGGIPNFSQQYTVFAQVYDGFDAYDKICAAEVVSEDNMQPKDSVVINKVYMSTYGENKNDSFFSLEDGESSPQADRFGSE